MSVYLYLIGIVLSYLVMKKYMHVISLTYNGVYRNSDMLFAIVMSILGHWVTFVIVGIMGLIDTHGEWGNKKSKY